MTIPPLDEPLRQRLVARYGTAVEQWLDDLPPVLASLAERWGLDLGPLIPLGHMSVVVRSRTGEGRPAVLKVCPDRERLAHEAHALARWDTPHVASVLEVDPAVGALLIESIEPGTMFLDQPVFPGPQVADLLGALHDRGRPDPSYPPLRDRVSRLFDSATRHRSQRPELVDVVPVDLVERGRRLAEELAGDDAPSVLLHGDLTPVNVLDGGPDRGLVAIDPAPCLGDPAFDAVDLLFWRAEDIGSISSRAEQLAPAVGGEADRLVAWCVAFAGMIASELASDGAPPQRVDNALALARRDR